MQSNASEKRPLNQPTAGAPEAVTRQTRAAEADSPTWLDMAADPAAEGVVQRTLLDVCSDLFGKLETSLVTNRQEFIDAYFATLVKHDEMTTLWTEPAYYEHLRTVIQKEQPKPRASRRCGRQ